MEKRSQNLRSYLSLALLVSFLITLNYSFGPDQSKRNQKSNIYSVYSVTSPTPVKDSDPVQKLTLQLFLISSLLILLIEVYRPKTRKALLASSKERNYFYENITINAP